MITDWHPDLQRVIAECDPDSANVFPFTTVRAALPTCPSHDRVTTVAAERLEVLREIAVPPSTN